MGWVIGCSAAYSNKLETIWEKSNVYQSLLTYLLSQSSVWMYSRSRSSQAWMIFRIFSCVASASWKRTSFNFWSLENLSMKNPIDIDNVLPIGFATKFRQWTFNSIELIIFLMTNFINLLREETTKTYEYSITYFRKGTTTKTFQMFEALIPIGWCIWFGIKWTF